MIIVGLVAAGISGGAPDARASETTGSISGFLRDTGGVPFTGSPSQNLLVSFATVSVGITRVDVVPPQPVTSQLVKADGSFALTDLAPGSYSLLFLPLTPIWAFTWYPGGLSETEAVPIEVVAGEAVVIEETLLAKGSLSMQVQQGDGTPIPAEDVSILEVIHISPKGTRTTTQDYLVSRSTPAATVQFTRLKPGSYIIRYGGGSAFETAYSPGVETVAEAVPIPVGPGAAVTGHVATVPPLPSFSGRVMVDGPSGPVPAVGAQILVVNQNPGGSALATTDSNGEWRVEGMRASEYRVCASEPAAYPATSPSFIETCVGESALETEGTVFDVQWGDQLSGLDITAEPAVRIYGTVAVRLDDLIERAPRTSEVRFWKKDVDGAWRLAASGPFFSFTGAFHSPPLEPGIYRVEYLIQRAESDLVPTGGLLVLARGYHPDAELFAEASDVELGTVSLRLPGDGDLVIDRDATFDRVFGSDRFATGVAVVEGIDPQTPVPIVYIVAGEGYADALSAGPAAAVQGGVMLLSRRDALPPSVAEKLAALQPQRVVLVGGTGVLSSRLEAQVRGIVGTSITVDRIGGVDRYDTSRQLVADAFADAAVSAVFLATGRGFPDALAAGPAASSLGGPVLLVDGARPTLDDPTLSLVNRLDPDIVLLAGSGGSVSPGIETQLQQRDASLGAVVRLGGIDRYATARAINDAVFSEPEYALVASGTGFADALSGGPLAAALGAPLYLSPGDCLHDATWAQLEYGYTLQIVLVGGTGVLSDSIADRRVC